MKRIVTFVLAIIAMAAVVLPSPAAEAQVVVYSNRCCDATNTQRCTIYPSGPLFTACYCNYQGWGTIC